MNILVVDDSLVMRRIICNHLRDLGFSSITEASDGKKALTVVQEQKVDLILSDWCMQVMHGIDLLREIRANEETKDVPFIMISAEAQPHLVMEAIQAKVSEYVVKPFTRDVLKESIEKVFRLGAAPH